MRNIFLSMFNVVTEFRICVWGLSILGYKVRPTFSDIFLPFFFFSNFNQKKKYFPKIYFFQTFTKRLENIPYSRFREKCLWLPRIMLEILDSVNTWKIHKKWKKAKESKTELKISKKISDKMKNLKTTENFKKNMFSNSFGETKNPFFANKISRADSFDFLFEISITTFIFV